MIPHHHNAVSMAKILMKESADKGVELPSSIQNMLMEIVNVQNYQIMLMNHWLEHHEPKGIPSATHARCGRKQQPEVGQEDGQDEEEKEDELEVKKGQEDGLEV